MRKVAFWGLSLVFIGALAKPAFAQQPKLPTTEIYNAYMAAYNETDPAKKAANAEKFIATYKDGKDTDHVAIDAMYMMALKSYYGGKNFPKCLELADKQSAMAPELGGEDKNLVPQIGLLCAQSANNKAKTEEWARKILTIDPKNLNALVTLSGLLADPSSLPADDAGKQKRFEETLTVTRRALAEPKPAAATAEQFKPIVLQLRHTECLVLLNQKKNAEAIESCKKAIEVDPKDSYAWYLTGLAMKPTLIAANNKYQDSVKNYNDNRDKGQLIVDDLKAEMAGALAAAQAKKDELIDVFSKAVAGGANGAAEAKKEIDQLNATN